VARLQIAGNELLVRLNRLEKLASLRGDVHVPLRSVKEVRATSQARTEVRGIGSPRTGFPGVIALGTWRGSFGKDFVAVYGRKPGVVVELDGAAFARLVVSKDDAEETAHWLAAEAQRASKSRFLSEATARDNLTIVVIGGGRILIRPFRSDELESWFAARLASAGDPTQLPASQPDRERLRERVERSGDMRDGALDLAIEFEGRLVGEIGTYREPDREIAPGLFFLSVALFDPADRGRGLGTEAVRLLCTWLFESAGATRIESGTAVSNGAMRAVFERLGFEFTGTWTRWGVEWAQYAISRGESRSESMRCSWTAPSGSVLLQEPGQPDAPKHRWVSESTPKPDRSP
jgi:RimJ/RimL family protein N-acetyltransferase